MAQANSTFHLTAELNTLQDEAKNQDKPILIIVLFVETPRKFITAVINLRGVSTNKTIICFIAMQTYKGLKPILIKIHSST